MAGTRAAQRRATQAALITVARQRFASEGYSAVRLSDVVDALGMTKGALYHQFAGKKDLFLAVLRQCSRRSLTGFRTPLGRARILGRSSSRDARRFLLLQ